MTPRLSVIIINYNGRSFLDELLASLESQTMKDSEILFIDNASTDGSTPYVRHNFPRIQVLAQARNLGFAAAGNLGMQLAAGKYAVTLNADLKLDPVFLESLYDAAESQPEAAAVAPKMRLYSQPDRLNGVGGCMNRLGYTWDRGMFEKDRGQYDRSADVLFASAGASLFRRSDFLSTGGFDERYFMYHEDVDLCWRFWLFGSRVITAPGAVVYHHFGGATRASRGMRWRELLGERNNICSLLKNYEMSSLAMALASLLMLRQAWSRKARQLQNVMWNAAHLPGTLRRRFSIQRRRRRSDRDLRPLIVQSNDVPIRL